MPLSMRAAWAQFAGTRDRQEDCAAVTRWDNGFHLLLLADGIGGHGGGREAGEIVIATMRDAFIDASRVDNPSIGASQALVTALQATNYAIYEYAAANPGFASMGSTLVAATFDGEALEWLSVGDSPLYLLRDRTLSRLNSNHSMAAVLAERVASGDISAQDAAVAPERSELLSAVMGQDISLIDESAQPLALLPGDIVVLASDGLDVLGEDSLAAALDANRNQTPEAGVDVLLAAVMALGRAEQDNTTVIVACIQDDPAGGDSSPDVGQAP